MSDYVQKKLDLIAEFYGVSLNPKHLYSTFPEECFLEQGQYLTGIFNAFDLLLKDGNVTQAEFIALLDSGSYDHLSIAVDKLYELVKISYADGVRPTKEIVLAWYSLLPFWVRIEDDIHEADPVNHLKFQIVSMVCMGIREPIINIVAERRKIDVQLDLVVALIKLSPSLINARNKLEMESGVNRGTLRKLMPEVRKQIELWDLNKAARERFAQAMGETEEDRLKSWINILRNQL